MYQAILRSHSGLRWIVLILLIVTVINAFRKWKANEAFSNGDDKLSLFTLIFAHIQLILGFYLFAVSPKVMLKGLDMGNAIARFFTVEHTLGMLIAIALITIGRVQSKKLSGALKHKKIFMMYLIALILILVSIPWPFRGLGAGWF